MLVGRWTQATRRYTPYDTRGWDSISNAQNRCLTGVARSGIHVAHPDTPPVLPLQCLQTQYVRIHPRLRSPSVSNTIYLPAITYITVRQLHSQVASRSFPVLSERYLKAAGRSRAPAMRRGNL